MLKLHEASFPPYEQMSSVLSAVLRHFSSTGMHRAYMLFSDAFVLSNEKPYLTARHIMRIAAPNQSIALINVEH